MHHSQICKTLSDAYQNTSQKKSLEKCLIQFSEMKWMHLCWNVTHLWDPLNSRIANFWQTAKRTILDSNNIRHQHCRTQGGKKKKNTTNQHPLLFSTPTFPLTHYFHPLLHLTEFWKTHNVQLPNPKVSSLSIW